MHDLTDRRGDDSVRELATVVAADLAEGEVLALVVRCAAHAVPGADGAGLVLLTAGVSAVAVCTSALAGEVDAAQRATGQGPGPLAAVSGGPVRWSSSGPVLHPDVLSCFASRARGLGVHSVLAVALLGPGGATGTLTLHARRADAFDGAAVHAALRVAGPAAATVGTTRDLAHARHVVEQLGRELGSRATVDQAVGVVMARTGATEPEALARLVADARTQGRAPAEVARDLLADAVRRARRCTSR